VSTGAVWSGRSEDWFRVHPGSGGGGCCGVFGGEDDVLQERVMRIEGEMRKRQGLLERRRDVVTLVVVVRRLCLGRLHGARRKRGIAALTKTTAAAVFVR
jgi:hypothetical protein